RLIAVFDRGAVVHVLAAAPAGDGGPEIIEDMAVEPEPLARREPDRPHADAVAFRDQHVADARVWIAALAPELRRDLRPPRGLVGAHRRLVHHRKRHGFPPPSTDTVYRDITILRH